MELPPHQIWYFRIDKEDRVVTNETLFKVAVKVSESGREFEKGDYCKVMGQAETKLEIAPPEPPKPVSRVYVPDPIIQMPSRPTRRHKRDDCDDDLVCVNRDMHSPTCEKIKQLAEDIMNTAYNLMMEGSMTETKYNDLLESLEQTKCDLEGTLAILNG
jgi:hypothetical protein